MTTPPLYEVLDPDALDALVAGRGRGVSLTFEYAGYEITVSRDAIVIVD
ncbi:HalOD1 output domain-containing protein [Haloprofundus salinisoli]|nr:HalOD1 output domain-containing protein [Haloprofundus salinisoli]